MAGGRTYTVAFHNISVAAVQDAIAAYCGSSMAIEMIAFGLSPCNPTVENLQVNVKHLPATVTAGSAGSSATPVPDAPTDAAATFTARTNDTTQATTSGSATYNWSEGFNEVNGLEFIFPERSRPAAKLSEALILEIATTPGGSRSMSGWARFRELF